MSIASKLKDLVIKWGGQPTKDDDSIEELIALLTELEAPGGGGLIEIGITSTDDGNMLQKTGQEILDYIDAGYHPYIIEKFIPEENPEAFSLNFLSRVETDTGGGITITSYSFEFGVNRSTFTCTSLSDHPILNSL